MNKFLTVFVIYVKIYISNFYTIKNITGLRCGLHFFDPTNFLQTYIWGIDQKSLFGRHGQKITFKELNRAHDVGYIFYFPKSLQTLM